MSRDITGTFDAVGDGNPVPKRAGRPRPEGHAPGRAECPRQCWWQARRWWRGGRRSERRGGGKAAVRQGGDGARRRGGGKAVVRQGGDGARWRGGGKAAVRQGGDGARRRGGEGPEVWARWADDGAAVRRRCWARAAPELTSRPPRRQFPPIPRESQEDIEAAGAPAEAGSATPSRTRPNGARWCGRRRLSVSRTRRGALSAPDLPDITQVTARNRLKMPQIPRRDL